MEEATVKGLEGATSLGIIKAGTMQEAVDSVKTSSVVATTNKMLLGAAGLVAPPRAAAGLAIVIKRT